MCGSVKKYSVPLTALLLSVWVINGCSKRGNPVDAEEILGDIFQLAEGRIWVTTAYELDTTGQKIDASVHREALYAHSQVTLGGRQDAYLMIDSIYSSGGSLSYVDTTYMAADEDNFYIYFGEWIPVFQRAQGLNREYTAGTFSTDEFGTDLDVIVRCKIFPKENVDVPLGTLEAYKLEIKFLVVFIIVVAEQSTTIWFADGVGPVKFRTPSFTNPLSGQKLNGSEELLVSTNF